ncbi:hypothetical protein DVK85_12705 [Flavobacterium arcticum]|uniref:Uncharacterized protein n=1 Tax=Flavobacterium arcticum TaxID=1784713 RepID=A0A345HEN1_9FLAO|nr:hypothetical protein [Flavobacterium arcticum]AXG75041.1 hypothetical protein DVK85_12705 [Flavobacterium arcticum]KAF2511176.1 hypothetical protein E0W72_07235 [Flavobacterium arcticum]
MIKWLSRILKPRDKVIIGEWRTKHSLYRDIINNINDTGKLPNGYVLPNNIKITLNEKKHKKASIYDVVFEFGQEEPVLEEIRELAKKLQEIALIGDKETAVSFYAAITKYDDVINLIDPFLEEISNYSLIIEPHLFAFANDMALNTGHQNSVKFGIAILGLCQNQVVIEKLKLLGLHEEFTLYVVIALLNLIENPEEDLFELGKQVNGWGKIQLVDRLARISESDEVKEWLITDGYKNNIHNQYLASTCAIHGELSTKLDHETIEPELYIAASEILDVLLSPGPCDDISSYEDAPKALMAFIKHSYQHANHIKDFVLLHKIKAYLNEMLLNTKRDNKWNDRKITDCLVIIAKITDCDTWKVIVTNILINPYDKNYLHAREAATLMGLTAI